MRCGRCSVTTRPSSSAIGGILSDSLQRVFGPGEHRLEPLPDGKTRVHFMERYHVVNPLMRLLLERRIHHFISKDNDELVRDGIVTALEHRRRDAAV